MEKKKKSTLFTRLFGNRNKVKLGSYGQKGV